MLSKLRSEVDYSLEFYRVKMKFKTSSNTQINFLDSKLNKRLDELQRDSTLKLFYNYYRLDAVIKGQEPVSYIEYIMMKLEQFKTEEKHFMESIQAGVRDAQRIVGVDNLGIGIVVEGQFGGFKTVLNG